MLSQRIFQIAAGYEDGDDCDLLRNDSLLKMCSGRTPDSSALSSQPTISRLENGRSIRELYDMGVCFVDEFISSYGEEPECIILDCDDSNFNAYGEQQGILFKQEVFKNTYLSNVSILTFRQKVLQSAVHIREMKTKIRIEFHVEHPFRKEIGLALERLALWREAG